MTQPKPIDPTGLDPAEAAKKIADAGIADETAAYVNAGDQAAPAEAEGESEAHPS